MIVYFFLALLWLGAAGAVGYCLYDCWDIISGFVAFLLICCVVVCVVECILLAGIGVAMIAGWH